MKWGTSARLIIAFCLWCNKSLYKVSFFGIRVSHIDCETRGSWIILRDQTDECKSVWCCHSSTTLQELLNISRSVLKSCGVIADLHTMLKTLRNPDVDEPLYCCRLKPSLQVRRLQKEFPLSTYLCWEGNTRTISTSHCAFLSESSSFSLTPLTLISDHLFKSVQVN